MTYRNVIEHIQGISSQAEIPPLSSADVYSLYAQELTSKICKEKVTNPNELTLWSAQFAAVMVRSQTALLFSLLWVRPLERFEHSPASKSTCSVGTPWTYSKEKANWVLTDCQPTPADTPLTPLEERLLTSLVRRNLAQSKENTPQIKTGGQVKKGTFKIKLMIQISSIIDTQPLVLVPVVSPRTPSSDQQCADGVMCWTRYEGVSVEGSQWSNSQCYLINELSRLPGSSKVMVSTEGAFKTDLQIPWNKLRVIRR